MKDFEIWYYPSNGGGTQIAIIPDCRNVDEALRKFAESHRETWVFVGPHEEEEVTA
jgi:hypothetical protein